MLVDSFVTLKAFHKAGIQGIAGIAINLKSIHRIGLSLHNGMQCAWVRAISACEHVYVYMNV